MRLRSERSERRQLASERDAREAAPAPPAVERANEMGHRPAGAGGLGAGWEASWTSANRSPRHLPREPGAGELPRGTLVHPGSTEPRESLGKVITLREFLPLRVFHPEGADHGRDALCTDTLRKRAQSRYAGGNARSTRRIPEATVARLPLYYRALLETADQEIGTVSSERLAELAGVNAAKVRKDLSYLGSYGTRGVGYDVEHLLHEISRELGLTHDWPVAIVGVGNLGPGARQLPRLRRPRLPHRRRWSTPTPRRSGSAVGELTIESLDDLPDDRADARRRHRHHRDAGARGPGGCRPSRRRGRHVDPQLRPDGRDRTRRGLAAQGRPRDRAADPVLLPTATRLGDPRSPATVTPREPMTGRHAARRATR